LYKLKDDPGETHDLAGTNTPKVHELSTALRLHIQRA
jgi:hypothetical protein